MDVGGARHTFLGPNVKAGKSRLKVEIWASLLMALAAANCPFALAGSTQPTNAPEATMGGAPDKSDWVDRDTGCVAPASPFSPTYTLPKSQSRDKYVSDLRDFFDCRQEILKSKEDKRGDKKSGLSWPNLGSFSLPAFAGAEFIYIASKISSWSGDIFWEPASKSTNEITRAGDEVRAVFGPIPDVDCRDGMARNLTLEVEGNRVDLKPNTVKAGSPLEFEHRDVDDNFVKWTASVPQCDKPSLAGGVTYCGMNSRLGRQMRGNVEWIVLCRKTKGDDLTTDAFWQSTDPSYKLLGYIGFNRRSGELAFFDGHPDKSFNWNSSIRPPGGSGYGDDVGRTAAENTYDPMFRIRCEGCHDNKEPRLITPHIKQQRVGYRDDARATKFSLGNLLPNQTRNRRDPYRVIGSGFTAVASASGTLTQGRAVEDPTGNCTGCHTLTTLNTGQAFAADAVGRGGSDVAAHRTEWALRTGSGKIHPWMVPGTGNVLVGDPAPMTDEDWGKLSACLTDPGGTDCTSDRLFTECPAPGAPRNDDTQMADLSRPSDLKAEIGNNRDADNAGFTKEVHVLWKYLNNLGGVPERDDVRFDLSIKEVNTPAAGSSPAPGEYPTIDQTKGAGAVNVQGPVYREGDVLVVKDIAFSGHTKWTDPPAATIARNYRVDFPAKCGKRYLIRVLPKRFCFDQSGRKYGADDHTLFADVTCGSL